MLCSCSLQDLPPAETCGSVTELRLVQAVQLACLPLLHADMVSCRLLTIVCCAGSDLSAGTPYAAPYRRGRPGDDDGTVDGRTLCSMPLSAQLEAAATSLLLMKGALLDGLQQQELTRASRRVTGELILPCCHAQQAADCCTCSCLTAASRAYTQLEVR